MMKTKKLIPIIILVLSTLSVYSQDYYLHCGSVLDVQTGKEIKAATIITSKNKIVKITDGYITKQNPNDIEIDLKNKFILPGLIDMHVHIESEQNPKSYASKFTNNEADIAFEAARFAEITLLAGFTTVRD
jgi:imidazolonepropionase-like amidohydrolase